MRNKRIVATVLLLLAWRAYAVAGQDQRISERLAALEKLPPKFSYAVLGDNRSGDDVYKKLLSKAMERKPDFIVNTGDQITNPGALDEWRKFWEMSRIVNVPYLLTVGNHDVNPRVSGSERTYIEQVDLPGNKLYYSFKAGDSLFIVLDSYLDDQEKKITGEQLKWLDGVLRNNKRRHTFVFLHHPLYPEKGRGKHNGNSLDRYTEDRDRLQALFMKHKVAAVFSGHEHLYLRKTVDGVSHIITGGGGAPLYADAKEGGFHHYILVTVDGDRIKGEVVDINGTVRDRF